MKVLIADDYPVIRQGVRSVLESHADIQVVAQARDGEELLELARTLEWDVAVIDYSMPGTNGVELVKKLKQLHPTRPVLVLSMYPEESHAIQALKAGASGYVRKDSVCEDLVIAVRKVARGGKSVSPTLAERMAEEVAFGTNRPLHELLSEREFSVMQLLAQGKQVNEISQELKLSPSTVSTYRMRILNKLKLKSNAELVRYTVEHLQA